MPDRALTINRRFTFRTEGPEPRWAQWWKYLSAMLGGGAVNYAAYSVVVVILPDFPLKPVVAVAVGSIVGMVINFLSAKLWVFKKR